MFKKFDNQQLNKKFRLKAITLELTVILTKIVKIFNKAL